MKHQITDYINIISKEVCEPYGCHGRKYQNPERVTHWLFQGDGSGDFEESSDSADIEVVASYIRHCQEQIKLGEEYIMSQKSEFNTAFVSAAHWLKLMSGVFDSTNVSPAETLAVNLWMRRRVEEASESRRDDIIQFGEVNTTLLATEAVYESGHFTGPDAEDILMDETHWIWDLVVQVDEWYKETKQDA